MKGLCLHNTNEPTCKQGFALLCTCKLRHFVLCCTDPALTWRANAEALAEKLGVSRCQRLEWAAWMCWLLEGRVARPSNRAERKGLFLFRGCLNRNPIFYNGSECPPARLLSCGIAPRQWAALALLLIF